MKKVLNVLILLLFLSPAAGFAQAAQSPGMNSNGQKPEMPMGAGMMTMMKTMQKEHEKLFRITNKELHSVAFVFKKMAAVENQLVSELDKEMASPKSSPVLLKDLMHKLFAVQMFMKKQIGLQDKILAPMMMAHQKMMHPPMMMRKWMGHHAEGNHFNCSKIPLNLSGKR